MKSALICMILILFSMCVSQQGAGPDELVILAPGEKLPDRLCTMGEEVWVIHSATCHACGTAMPRIKSVEQKLGAEFRYFDLAVPDERNLLMQKGFIPQSIPTVLADCTAYTGAKSEKEYERILGE